MSTRRGQSVVGTTTLVGTKAIPVEVQVDVGNGLPSFVIVGLGDAAVLEARERVRAAIRSSGYDFPNARIVVNLAPGPLRKHGTGFDLPIALGILRATGQLNGELPGDIRAVGELSLDGTVRRVRGMLAHILGARRDGRVLVGPLESSHIAAGVPEASYRPLDSLRTIPDPASPISAQRVSSCAAAGPDLADISGLHTARRALEIAAAGGHNLLFTGPPGSGKTMLARRLGPILPALSADEGLESAVIHSIAGLDEAPVIAGVRPFRAPHHSASTVGLIGGGSPLRPGEISLAHAGVLFMDELPQFGPATLQSLRQPMEDGHVTLVRAEGRISLPARFALVAAANPCPCGFAGDPVRACRCSPPIRERYRTRVGGPLVDRIDLMVAVQRIDPSTLIRLPSGESSALVRTRVSSARASAIASGVPSTEQLSGIRLLAACAMDTRTTESLESITRSTHLSGRGVTRLLRVARTIAFLEQSTTVQADHLYEALLFRGEELR